MKKANPYSIKTGKRLKMLREERKLSHESLSKAILEKYGIKISTDSLMNYEVTNPSHPKIGKNEGMRIEYLRCFADFYGVSSDYLLGLSDIRSTDLSIRDMADKTGLSEHCIQFLLSLWNVERRIEGDYIGGISFIDSVIDCFSEDAAMHSLNYQMAIDALKAHYEGHNLPNTTSEQQKVISSLLQQGFQLLPPKATFNWFIESSTKTIELRMKANLHRACECIYSKPEQEE